MLIISFEFFGLNDNQSKTYYLKSYYNWEEDTEDIGGTLYLGISWTGSKVMFIFDGEESDTVLGSNREIRVALGKHLEDFLSAGIHSIKAKTAEILE